MFYEFLSALKIDIKKRDFPGGHYFNDLSFACAIFISVHFKVLDELSGVYHFLELRLIDKVIFDPIFLFFARLPSGVRNTEAELVRIIFAQLFDKSGLANSGGSEHDEWTVFLIEIELKFLSSPPLVDTYPILNGIA